MGFVANFSTFFLLFRASSPLSSTGGGNSGLYRWDPAKSMKDVAQNALNADHQKPAAEQKYADITTITDENYFSIVSAERLGTVQTYQFQSIERPDTDYQYWRSKCTAEGECDISATGSSNELAQMPRSSDSLGWRGRYYNWYSATAENGKYNTVGNYWPTTDSICPSGWRLPLYGDWTVDKSYNHLVTFYGITAEATTSWEATRYPVSFPRSVTFWENGAPDKATARRIQFGSPTYVHGTGGKYFPYSVRCVRR